ncbi:nonstructural protein [Flumine parvovirus 19]|nr:nonstructural protein [Flumine parvovirus 19]
MPGDKQVAYTHADRQWDARFNVQSDEYLVAITERIMEQFGSGKLQWVLISGVEVGTCSTHSDYRIRHVHVGAIFENRVTKASILKNWGIVEGNGYYLVPRNRDLRYQGWRDHHLKVETKVDPDTLCIYEAGELPKDSKSRNKVERSEIEKKETTDEIIRRIKTCIEDGNEEEAFNLYPRNWMMYGEKLKAMINQKRPDVVRNDPHLWVHGFAGTGKTLLLEFVYPKRYKKDLNNQFMDLYDPKYHTHIMLEDYDHATADKLGIQFLKTICDEAGFPVNQKYKGGFLANTTVLVTSQFTINDIIPEGQGVEETRAALHRRFIQICVSDLLRLLGLKLIPSYERKQLKFQKNVDMSKLFMTWDYVQNQPTGNKVESPEHYQAVILGYTYA